MAKQFLLDINTVIYYLNSTLPRKSLDLLDISLVNACNISVITKIEVLGWEAPNPADNIVYEEFIGIASIFSLSDDIVNKTIELRKNYKIKLPDAIIAATAMVENLILVSRNDSDFVKIQGLDYQNPFNW